MVGDLGGNWNSDSISANLSRVGDRVGERPTPDATLDEGSLEASRGGLNVFVGEVVDVGEEAWQRR